MPLFSVVIPVYNRHEQVRRAIDSVLAQDCNDYEIIIVDDGSTDSTEKISHEYSGRIRYLRQDNRGVSSARNTGIKNSTAPYIAFLDSDDQWHREKLSRQRDFIQRNPHISIHQCDEIWIRNTTRVNPAAKHKKSGGFIFESILMMCTISPSCVVISREIFERYGFFDENMQVCEDYDLWIRVTPFEEIGLIDEKLVTRYSGHDGQLSAAYWGMDRFRLYSILKLLEQSGGRLTDEQKNTAVGCAMKKLSILGNGADKRSNVRISVLAENLIQLLRDGCCTKKDYQSLLEI